MSEAAGQTRQPGTSGRAGPTGPTGPTASPGSTVPTGETGPTADSAATAAPPAPARATPGGTGSIVLIHAIRSSRTMWKGQRRRLRDWGFEVIAPDLPGHGRRRGETFTLEGALATIDETVAACEEPPLLVGLSLGGFLTLHWAGTHPGRLAGVVAADCTIVPGPASARLYGLWITMKDVLPGDSDSRVARAFARRHTRKAAKRYYGGGRAHGVVRAVVRLIGGLDLLADVAAIDVPLTLVNGEHDPFRRHEALFLEAARDGELVILKDAGHIANLSRPKRFAKLLRDRARPRTPLEAIA